MLELKPERFDLGEYHTQAIAVSGRQLLGDQSGALVWPAQRALVVADMHCEKASHFAGRGQLLPPYDTRQTLMKLAAVVDRHEPELIVSLGDGFHDAGGAGRMHADDLNILRIIQEGRRWVWVTGNHDPEIAVALGGEIASALELDGLVLRHEPRSGRVTHEIAGHLHPAAKISAYGHALRRPCFIGNGRRLILPAFGALTGGLNVLDTAFEPLFGNDGFAVWMLGQEGLYPVSTRQLVAD
ncbi:MAG: ligase-associated DNA damage response endonuclease PdeM [Hyphomicrobiaceae bacterium]